MLDKTSPIYIAGPMTGILNNNRAAFIYAEMYLKQEGWTNIYNPINTEIDLSIPVFGEKELWLRYVLKGLEALEKCANIYMLLGWEASCGASIEHTYAKLQHMNILLEEETIPF